ncbi:MAG TPA: polysaccharide deacetylase family protein [Thermoanaerobaculia bacterium]|nr:polysaccharide deacetylase family protein [Thermoanaerobaculia bacterium]
MTSAPSSPHHRPPTALAPRWRLLAGAALLLTPSGLLAQAAGPTYAERLGWAPGDRVAIFHVDDAGMSHQSNVGAIRSIEEGVATSMSVMMPCGWVPELMEYLRAHPETDAGLHLTLTSEWDGYRWPPVVGAPQAPGLADPGGYLWDNVPQVVAHATADEVEAEIRAQIAKSRAMGWEPTHLDSHMGTLFATPAFVERYIKVGIETGIPVMMPGGHNTALRRQYHEEAVERLKRRGEWHGQELPEPPELAPAPAMGRLVWEGGLPVLDDLHNTSYGWRLPEGVEPTDDNLRRLKVERYAQAVRELEPGVTMIILHATDSDENFERISGSAQTRRGDLLAMIAPELRKVIEEEGVTLTTWRELGERRKRVGDGSR